MKKKVLILYYTQFGYHIDSYMYARYADRQKFELCYYCFDMGLKRIEIDGVVVKYIPLFSNRFKSYILFLKTLKKYVLKEKFDLIFQIDGKFSLAIRILNLFSPMALDIRSGDLSNKKQRLWLRNHIIRISSLFYKHVSVISESLSKELRLNPINTTIIPLGGELHNFDSKKFYEIRLLYVGSLNNRNIEQTIIGLSLFISKNPKIRIKYEIIGFGNRSTEEKIRDSIISCGISDLVNFHGRKTHQELTEFFKKCNVGIVYIPQKRYYDFQPSTKFYEFLLAGLPVIATNTLENRISLKENCGILCEDNPESFSAALSKFLIEKDKYNSEKIKKAYLDFQWEHIVKYIWEPYILNAIK